MHITFDTPVSNLPGIGPRRAERFEKLGVTNVRELLYTFPRAYRNKGDIHLLSEASDGEVCPFLLTVSDVPKSVMLKGRLTLTKFRAFDESGVCTVVYYNQRYLDKYFTPGSVFRFYGKLHRKRSGYELASPEHEAYYEGAELPPLVPVYRLCEGLTQKIMRSVVECALNELRADECPDVIPEDIRRRFGLEGVCTALRHIHRPEDTETTERARKRFAFEEFFIFALGAKLSASARSGGAPAMKETDLSPLYGALPYEPTGAQLRTIGEIAADLSRPEGVPMSRLVSGDVGSGKTLCACAAAYIAAKNGYQTALMAPTEILAEQHYADLSPLFAAFGISCALLTSSCRAAAKREVREGLESGDITLVIGTHALISDNVTFSSLGLVITDEQHRFGVAQRAALSAKSHSVHTLVMSATPIPRTLALILYGDLDISVVDEMPPGRQRVDTYAVDESYRDRINNFIRKQAEQGSQTYIVCPAIETEEEASDDGFEGEVLFDFGNPAPTSAPKLKSVVDYAKKLRTEVFPDLRIGLIHGKLKAEEKEKVMQSFVRGEIDVLVSTTVIEVGVNVPNATLMIVENAERFGLSQLHQLRGRVGRGNKKSYCILVSDSSGEAAQKRLSVMHDTYDGYAIAQRDLEMRGPGDFLPSSGGSARQSGAAGFRFASLCEDMDTLKYAFDSAQEICAGDPQLSRPEHAVLRAEVEAVFDTAKGAMN